MGFAVTTITPPSSEPVSLTELKSWLRVDIPDDDDLITDLGIAAREQIEAAYDCAIVSQVLQLTLDRFPYPGNPYLWQQYSWGYWLNRIPMMGLAGTWWPERAAIFVPRPPLLAVNQIQYIAGDGTLTTLAPSSYLVDTERQPGRITPAWGQFWPILRLQMNSVTVQYTAGFGDAAACPKRLKQAIKVACGYWYENRETAGNLPDAVYRLCDAIWSGEYY